MNPTIRIVVFGASAGGLQALRPIISQLQTHGDSAYVVAHHLAAHYPSNLEELLARNSRLTVTTARHDEVLEVDHVYICPPGQEIAIQQGKVILTPRAEEALVSPSVNRLLYSLAEQCGSNAVAVILSGSGHDGLLGAKAVNQSGGLVLVQSPEQAIQHGMPDAVIQAGIADLVGNSEQIAAWLNDIVNLEQALTPVIPGTDEPFEELFQWVSTQTGIDLSRYKDNTLRRQTTRRYRNLGFASLAEYFAHVRADQHELQQLQQSFLISVSAFFRDGPVFEALAVALRRLVVGKLDGESIRVWIPGCATGEEAYSIAMLLAEILGERLRKLDVRIFATDIDQNALEVARAGLYGDAALSALSSERRQRWFVADGLNWRIAKEIRELCVFSMHDVISHPPFIRMDLISCRNLMIYFKAEQQNDLINTFHYGLNGDGLLLLGNSESAGFNSALFEALEVSHRLYRRLAGNARHSLRFSRLGNNYAIRPRLPKVEQTPQRKSLVEAAQLTIAQKFGPPAVLVDGSFEPLHFFGRAQRYFALSEDSVDFSVFALCVPELRSELKALCYRLMQESLSALDGIPVPALIQGEARRVRPCLRRVETADPGDFALLICFEESAATEAMVAATDHPPTEHETAEIARLRQELADTREHLQAVIEELESSNEELQSLNEEVQASSEELQASNEELQSSNEELTTLNDELRFKSSEADELTTSLSNIQNSISTSLVVVDQEGRITRYNALATRIFGLVAQDLGQFLYGVPCHLQLPQLREQVSGVISGGVSLVERVHQGEFHFLMKIDPYRTETGGWVGAVLTFADISELHRAEQAQASSEIRFRQVWETTLEGLLVVDDAGHIVMSNPALQRMFGYSEDELLGQSVEKLVPMALRARHADDRVGYGKDRKSRQMARTRDVAGLHKNGSEFYIEVSLSAMVVADTHYVLASVTDITLRKQALLALRQSETRLRLALDSAGAGTWEWHLASNENIWSDEIWNLFGLPEHSVVPSFEAWSACIHPSDKDRVLQTLSEAVAENHEFEFVWQVKLPEGEAPRWMLSRGRPLFGADGRPTQYIGIVFDISERKRAESELEQHRNMLEQQVEQRTQQLGEFYNRAPCGYHSLDHHGLFININDTELAWLGYEREELIGRIQAQDILTAASREVFRKNFPRLLEQGVINDLELEFQRKDGSILPVLLNARAVYDEQGQFSHTLSTMIDNTDRKRAERAWIAAREAAESANRAKTAFLANMSHEIRTPLSAIIGLSHIIRRGHVEPEHAAKLLKIDQSAKHLLALVNDILDLSKIEAEKFELDEVDFDLPTAVQNALTMIQERLAGKAITLTTEIDPTLTQVRGDATRFTQALLNLAGNAVKFTEQGAITIRLQQQATTPERMLVRVEVEDSGIGVPSEVLPRLFAPFEQGDMSTTRKYGGTGLGLAITRRLAELMGGAAGASTGRDRGSLFWFTAWLKFPVNLAAVVSNRVHDVADEEVLKRDFCGQRVMLVEDEPINRDVIGIYLDDIGLQVTPAGNGLEAVNLARNQTFALVLMDMQMPEMDGIEATRIIRTLPGWADIPIIAITANAFAEDRARCINAGMVDFITKPIDPDQFFATLLRWLRSAGEG